MFADVTVAKAEKEDRSGWPVDERLNTVLLSPEMCSLNMGLLNFFIRGEQVFFANHRSDIEHFAHEIAARDVRPELEIYSAAFQ